MITNFEEYTFELNDNELKLIPILIRGFNTHSESNPIKATEIIKQMNDYLVQNNAKIRLTQPRLRKCCNYIRSNGMIPLIATSRGYYVSTDKEIIRTQIDSLIQRANSIKRCADGLKVFVNNSPNT